MREVSCASRAASAVSRAGEDPHLRRVVGGGLDRLGEQAHRAHRRLQLVARVGDEVAPHLLDALALGDVAQDEQREARRDPRRADDHESRLGRRGAAAQAQRRRGGATPSARARAGDGAQLVGGQRRSPRRDRRAAAAADAARTVEDASTTTAASSMPCSTSRTPSGIVERGLGARPVAGAQRQRR